MRSMGISPSGFYCGLTNNLKERLAWHRARHYEAGEASSIAVARRVEKYFLDLGCDGGDGGGTDDSVHVYLYVITFLTRER